MNESIQAVESSLSSFIFSSLVFTRSAVFAFPSSSFSIRSYLSGYILQPSAFILALVGVSLVVGVVAWLHHRKGAGGPLGLEGRVGSVLNPLEPEGAVLVDGELWRARTQSGERIVRGRVRIVGARGHWLEVEPE